MSNVRRHMNHLTAIARPTLSTRSALVTRAAWFAAVAVALDLALHVQAAPPDEWPVIGQQGLVRFVVVPPDKATDQASYEEQIVRLCEPERTCFLNFYTNSTQAAPSVPLPEAIANEATATYRRSMKNGVQFFAWSCRLKVPGRECF
jgi:hypothetical protein